MLARSSWLCLMESQHPEAMPGELAIDLYNILRVFGK